MKIESQPTTSTMAEAAEAKAKVQLLLEVIEMARQCIDADDVIGAHQILVRVLGEKE
jgi:hypothetical protein